MSDKEETSPEKEGSPKGEKSNGVTSGKSRSRSSSSSRSGSHRSNSRSVSRSKSRSGSEKSASKSRSRSHSSRERSQSRSRSRSRGKKSAYSRSRKRSYSRSRSHSPRYRKKSSYRSRSRSRSPPPRRSHYGYRRNDNRDNPEPSRCLGVFGLSLYTTERDLRNLFEKYSEVESIQIVYDHQTGRSRGYAFVYFPNEKYATTCKERTNGQELDGRQIRVDYSVTKNPHNPTPGVYMGKPSQFSRKPYRGGSSRYDRSDRHSSSYRSRSRSRSYSPRRY